MNRGLIISLDSWLMCTDQMVGQGLGNQFWKLFGSATTIRTDHADDHETDHADDHATDHADDHATYHADDHATEHATDHSNDHTTDYAN